ncbi:DUF6364 family protein [Moheibacter lacus]|uniref:Uncharacterized protein n=1 Tax=Moheibacter lacus TaxID=2745851 RepID=A0A838ZT11_9FLAO|nr:DUF6364 family protein [Moheibacter lacus]MBA5630120.1 hypothetical protein [Moheibacter lacus]
MDAKITLSFDQQVIKQAKEFAEKNNISLSRLTEFIYRQMTSNNYKNLEDLPIADWVNQIAEEKPEYGKSFSRKKMKSDFFDSKK